MTTQGNEQLRHFAMGVPPHPWEAVWRTNALSELFCFAITT